MSPARTAGAHRRSGPPPLAAVLDELRRTRAERDQLAGQLADVEAERDTLRDLIAAPDATRDPEYWRALFADAHRGEVEAAYRRGREDEGRERDQAWQRIARPIARSGPTQSALEILRYGPPVPDCPRHGEDCTGRLHFADPRPGDYMGGPVEWQPTVAVADVEDVEAVAS